MKKKIGLMAVATALVVVTVIGGAFASFQSDSIEKTQEINTRTLGLSLGSDKMADLELKAGTIVPGEEIKREMNISNDNDVDFYARVKISRYWLNEDGQKNSNMEPEFIKIISNAKKNGWIAPSFDGKEVTDKEDIVLYYTKPVKPGETTTNFLDGVMVDKDVDNYYANCSGEIDITADAAQAFDSANALMSEWGVAAEVDSNGTILSIEE